MLRDVGCSATILATECQALQQAQTDQDHGSGNANRRVAGQDADDKCRQTHDQDGHQEGVFAPDHVPQTAKHQGPERTDNKSRGKRQQGENEGGAFIKSSKELLGNDGRQ